MSYLNWHVGMKVVCVDDQWAGGGLQRLGFQCPLEAGATYTITAIHLWRGGTYNRPNPAPIAVELAEVDKPHHPSLRRHPGFNAARFRPIQTRKTDISIFTRILRNPHVRIKEDA